MTLAKFLKIWWPGTELNRRRQPFQGCALPPELPGHVPRTAACRSARALRFSRSWRGPATEESRKGCGTLLIITTGSVSLNVAADSNAACQKLSGNATSFGEVVVAHAGATTILTF